MRIKHGFGPIHLRRQKRLPKALTTLLPTPEFNRLEVLAQDEQMFGTVVTSKRRRILCGADLAAAVAMGHQHVRVTHSGQEAGHNTPTRAQFLPCPVAGLLHILLRVASIKML